MAAPADDGARMSQVWHRVCLNTIVRKGVALDSERLRILPMGSRVHVVEQQDRRVRIDQPIAGWCSLKSSNGDTILTPLQDDEITDQAPVTPSGTNVNADQLARKAQNATAKTEQNLQKLENRMRDEFQNDQEVQKLTGNIEMLTRSLGEARRQKEELLHRAGNLEQKKKETAQENSMKREQIGEQEGQIADLQMQLSQARETLEEKVSGAGSDMPGNKEEGQGGQKIQKQYQETQADFRRAQEKLRHARMIQNQQQMELQTVKETVENMNNDPYANVQLNSAEICENDVVMMKGGIGIVVIRYVGPLEGKNPQEEYVGYEVSEPDPEFGFCDGEYEGVRYFETPEYCANFAPVSDVRRRITPAQLLQQLHEVMKQIERGGNAKE